MKKHLLCLIAGAMILASCSSSESSNAGGYDLSMVGVKQAFTGADELMGAYYEKFTLPESFGTPEITELYELTVNTADTDLGSDRVKRLFYDYLGEGAEYGSFVTVGNNTGYHLGFTDVSDPIGSCSYTGNKFRLYHTYKRIDTGETFPEHYRCLIGSGTDTDMTIIGKPTTSEQEAAYIEKYLDELFEGCFDFGIKTQLLDAYSNGDITANCAFAYAGVPIQSFETAYSGKAGNSGKEYYAYFNAEVGLAGNNVFWSIVTTRIPRLVDKQSIEQIISLKRAVGILQNVLDTDEVYTFSDVRLMYCGKEEDHRTETSKAELKEQEEKEFDLQERVLRPMWCFFILDPDSIYTDRCIKVNAVTGEVILDL
ncbi:MAG: hypothetical protein IKP95_00395 [Ruminococcus sp.]|nr:hypothetical protein [Ruminococcus sp.]